MNAPFRCIAVAIAATSSSIALAQTEPWAEATPDVASLVKFDQEESDLRLAVTRFSEDGRALMRRYDTDASPVRWERMKTFYNDWLASLKAVDFESLNREGQIDYVLLRSEIEFQLSGIDQAEQQLQETSELMPFLRELQQLQEKRRDREDVDGRASADVLDRVADQIDGLKQSLSSMKNSEDGISKVAAYRAARQLDGLRRDLRDWHGYYAGYDPLFTWWTAKPYEKLNGALESYANDIRRQIVGLSPRGDDEGAPIIGDPIGEDGLASHLKHEFIPYSPSELIAIAEQEFAWCEEQLLKASNEMGHGDDWKAAQEEVKQAAVDPGDQPAMVRDMATMSEAFIAERDLVTIPPMAQEIWRMEMLSPQRQLTSPFFLGGEVVQIAYPTDEMQHADKLMSMRGNNPHFSYGTVQHELIPGHHLQGFMTDRFNPHRGVFNTPFWTEGWALYWEMRLWDLDFPQTPQDKVGMLFWRMHRCARIIFSLKFHLGEWTPQQCIDFLVDRVGHERANAEAEVRRSFIGTYPPLYQVGYMIGGMQIRAMHEELVENGDMTEREFHDRIITGGRMPIEMVRARLTAEDAMPLTPDYETQWKFNGDIEAQ